MKTFKIPYRVSAEDKSRLDDLRRRQSIVIRTSYNECFEGNSDDQSITNKVKSYNLDLLARIVLCGVKKGQSIFKAERELKKVQRKQFEESLEKLRDKLAKCRNRKSMRKCSRKISRISDRLSHLDKRRIVFGTRAMFYKRQKHKVSNEDFKRSRLLNLVISGETLYHGNRHCTIDMVNRELVLKIGRHVNPIILRLPKDFKNMESEIRRLSDECLACKNKFSVEIGDKYVCISYEEFQKDSYEKIPGRILAFDDNPNYIGLSVTDWDSKDSIKPVKIVYKEVIDKSNLVGGHYEFDDNGDRKFTRHSTKYKIDYETTIIAKHIITLARHFQCDRIVKEELEMQSSDKGKGRHFNRLCNNDWNREKFCVNLRKRCHESGIDLVEVLAMNSSKLGNVLYGEDDGSVPDMVASSIELARRGNHCEKIGDKFYFRKGEKLYPCWSDIKACLNRWKEEAMHSKSLDAFLKTLVGDTYRVKLREIPGINAKNSLNNIKSKVNLYHFL